jgi:hypothetical protein
MKEAAGSSETSATTSADYPEDHVVNLYYREDLFQPRSAMTF